MMSIFGWLFCEHEWVQESDVKSGFFDVKVRSVHRCTKCGTTGPCNNGKQENSNIYHHFGDYFCNICNKDHNGGHWH